MISVMEVLLIFLKLIKFCGSKNVLKVKISNSFSFEKHWSFTVSLPLRIMPVILGIAFMSSYSTRIDFLFGNTTSYIILSWLILITLSLPDLEYFKKVKGIEKSFKTM